MESLTDVVENTVDRGEDSRKDGLPFPTIQEIGKEARGKRQTYHAAQLDSPLTSFPKISDFWIQKT